MWRRGVAVECRTRDQEVAGSSLSRALRRKNSGQVFHTYVPLSCPNSITSILLKTCLKPGFRQVLSRKKVGHLVSDKIDLSRHVEIDLAAGFRQIKKSGTWSQTSFEQKKSRKPGLRQVLSRKKVGNLVSDFFCRKKVGRPGLRLVCDLVSDKSYDKIDLMEFGLHQAV